MSSGPFAMAFRVGFLPLIVGRGLARPLRARASSPLRRAPRARAFTMLELLLVIAVIGLLGSVLVIGGARVLSPRPAPPEEVFWEAVSQARKTALLNQVEVRLSYDADARVFQIQGPRGAASFPILIEGEVHVDLLSAQRTGSTILIGGNLVETQPLAFVTFFDDGTCVPFRVQLRTTGEAEILAVDPWTCAPVLPRDPEI